MTNKTIVSTSQTVDELVAIETDMQGILGLKPCQANDKNLAVSVWIVSRAGKRPKWRSINFKPNPEEIQL